MAARFGPLPRSSPVKRRNCTLRSAPEELGCHSAWVRATVRLQGAQLSSSMAAHFVPLLRSSSVKR
eukprot:7497078-Heterocapsa_arctica.AAC.1